VGLIIFSIAVGSYTNTPQFAFMIGGGGSILFAVIMGMIKYLKRKM